MGVRFLYPEGKVKALTLSYDDGVKQDRRLVEIFNQYGLKGSFHLNSGTWGSGNRLDESEVAAVYQGHEISCHSVSHPFLERLPQSEIMREIFDDRRNLEKLAGYPVIGMSYPFGTYSQSVIEIATAAGIKYSRTTRSHGWYGIPDDFLEWHPTCHHNDDLISRTKRFFEIKYQLALFYVWGHAYEFDNDNNWGLIEEFAKLASGRFDVWYATNIEIYHYLTAIRQVVVSADGTLLYNPNGLTLWYSYNERVGSILPGETKDLTDL